jgi:hypothetical protein
MRLEEYLASKPGIVRRNMELYTATDSTSRVYRAGDTLRLVLPPGIWDLRSLIMSFRAGISTSGVVTYAGFARNIECIFKDISLLFDNGQRVYLPRYNDAFMLEEAWWTCVQRDRRAAHANGLLPNPYTTIQGGASGQTFFVKDWIALSSLGYIDTRKTGKATLEITFSEDIDVFYSDVGGVAVTVAGSGGTGYPVNPTVTIGAPDLPTGVQATATATVSAGVVQSLTIVNSGSGYITPPSVTVSGGTGGVFGAALTGSPGAASYAVTGIEFYIDKIEVPYSLDQEMRKMTFEQGFSRWDHIRTQLGPDGSGVVELACRAKPYQLVATHIPSTYLNTNFASQWVGFANQMARYCYGTSGNSMNKFWLHDRFLPEWNATSGHEWLPISMCAYERATGKEANVQPSIVQANDAFAPERWENYGFQARYHLTDTTLPDPSTDVTTVRFYTSTGMTGANPYIFLYVWSHAVLQQGPDGVKIMPA